MPARKLAVHVKDFVTDLGMQYKPDLFMNVSLEEDHTDYIKILTDTPKGDLCFGFCCFGNAFMMMLLMLFAFFTGGHCNRWTLHSFVACGDEVQNIWICFCCANMWHLLHFEPDIACDVCACNLCVQMSDLGSVKSEFNGNVLQTEAWRLSQHPAHLHRVLHVGRLEGHGQQNPWPAGPQTDDQPAFPPPKSHRSQKMNLCFIVGFAGRKAPVSGHWIPTD